MTDKFHYLDEPLLSFGLDQTAEDPRDGLALYGPHEQRDSIADYVVIGTTTGLDGWDGWCEALNGPAACEDIARQRAWPPYPGFDVAFGATWPAPLRRYTLNAEGLEHDAQKADSHQRAHAVANHYLQMIDRIARLDSTPALVVCVVPDLVYQNCRPKSYVSTPSDGRWTSDERRNLRRALKDQSTGQEDLFAKEERETGALPDLEPFGFSPDFRRQIKARMMAQDLSLQLIRESTVHIAANVRRGEKGVNPLSDRLWNFGTAVFYKSGLKPWSTPWARRGVCYVGLTYRRAAESGATACCAAQMFLDNGDGLVFVGEFGPWYSEEKRECHLNANAAEELLRDVIAAYQQQQGESLREVFLHARSGFDEDELSGFARACPRGVNLVGIRVRKESRGLRLFRYDEHPTVARRGMYPVLRGTLWERTPRHGLLMTSGFKPRLAVYDGWEVPVPLTLTIQYGDADLLQVARDILGLTKLNYNACRLGGSQPITVKYSDRVGEILLANPNLGEHDSRHNFRFYI